MRTELHGARVFYGTGNREPVQDARTVVFIHGAGFDHAVWVMPARYFARHGWRVIAPDLPAHGRSEGNPLTTIEAMADWLAALLAQEVPAGQAALVVGHSMGSLVALALAGRHPQWVAKLALLGTSTPMQVGPPLLQAALDNDHAAIDMANTWSHSTQGALGAAQSPGLSNLHSGERWLERMSPGVYHADLAACHAYQAVVDVGTTPVLVIAGMADRMTPARAGLQLAGQVSQGQAVQLPGCGHAMLSEQPNAVLDALIDFSGDEHA